MTKCKTRKPIYEESRLDSDDDENELDPCDDENELDHYGEVDELDVEDINFNRAILLALNTCYHVGLQNEASRERYRTNIAPIFRNPSIDSDYINDEINICYEVFLDEIQLPDAIARNQVLF